MIDLSKEIDFSQDIKAEPRLLEFIKLASEEIVSSLPPNTIKKPFLDTQFDNYVVVCGLPKTTSDKLEKLTQVIERYLEKLGLKETYEAIFYGFQDDTNKNTNGTALLDFGNPENALNAANKLNNLAFDKNHNLKAHISSEYEKIINTSSQYNQPVLLPRDQLKSWLLDVQLLDQYSIRTNQKITVNWFNHLEKKPANALISPYLEIKDSKETKDLRSVQKIEWSKNGTYLIVFGANDFGIFGGPQFQQLAVFHHLALKNVETSPNEKYILSFNGTINDSPNTENYIVWNLETTEKLRVYKADAADVWGAMKFSPDSKYIAMSGVDSLSVYELPNCSLIKDLDTGNKIQIKVQGIKSFSWIENSNMILCASYDYAKKETNPRAITLLEVPFSSSKKDGKKWKSINWEISKCDIFVSQNGEWVCLVMQKKGKKQGGSTFIHLANMKSKRDVEIADLDLPDKVKSFSFDTKNGRFAFVFEDQAPKEAGGHIKYEAAFYGIETDPNTKIKDYGKVQKSSGKTSEVLFSSNGLFFAIVNKDLTSTNQGNIEFGYLKPVDKTFTPEVIKLVVMSYLSMACWDPSGRFLITGSSQTKTFIVHNAYGEHLYKETFTNDLSQFLWRNRPRNLLDSEKENAIQSNFKNYKTKYEESDDRIINRLKYEREQKRDDMKKKFLSFLDEKRKEWDECKKERIDLRGFDSDDYSDVTMEEYVEYEQVIDTKQIENKQG